MTRSYNTPATAQSTSPPSKKHACFHSQPTSPFYLPFNFTQQDSRLTTRTGFKNVNRYKPLSDALYTVHLITKPRLTTGKQPARKKLPSSPQVSNLLLLLLILLLGSKSFFKWHFFPKSDPRFLYHRKTFSLSWNERVFFYHGTILNCPDINRMNQDLAGSI